MILFFLFYCGAKLANNADLTLGLITFNIKKLLVQSGAALFDALHGLAYIVVAGSITHAEALWVAKGITAYRCHMTYLQQIHGEVIGVVDDTLTIGFAEVALTLGEHVEGSVGIVYLEAWYLLYQTYDEVAAALESFAHILYALL